MITTPRAKKPAIRCTQPAAPTSWKPHSVVNQPLGCQLQAAPRIHTTEPRMIARTMKALIRVRSMIAPDMIEAVVAANSTNAAQKMPVALSCTLGPMLELHGRLAAAPSRFGTRPVAKPL
ncbi:hypothetical protein D3C75_758980 [compost metagenome]